mmetsp:Transcript_11051/g.20064  ORF Transcript_11051/g.20064 Transcript_11051/m.20064 type:complete len:476 (-) Transcript_11051:55-1482(-)
MGAALLRKCIPAGCPWCKLILLVWSYAVITILVGTSPQGAGLLPESLRYAGEGSFPPPLDVQDIGYFYYMYKEPAWMVRESLFMVSRHSYGAAILIQSDAGNDFSELCAEYLSLTPEQAGAPATTKPRCKFEMAPFRLAETQPAGKRGMLFKQEALRKWAPRWHKAIAWLATEWVILMEVDNIVLRRPAMPPGNVDFMDKGNWDHEHTPYWLMDVVRKKCGNSAVYGKGQGSTGGFMFRSKAWIEAYQEMQANLTSPWSVIFYEFAGAGGGQANIYLLEMACKVGVKSMDFVNVGSSSTVPETDDDTWSDARHKLKLHRVWPYGADLSYCYDCLRQCQEQYCDSYGKEKDGLTLDNQPKLTKCVMDAKCQCPAILHNAKGGLCGGYGPEFPDHRCSFKSYEQRNWHEDMLPYRTKFLACAATGLCPPSATPIYRQGSLMVHGGIVISVLLLLVREGRQYLQKPHYMAVETTPKDT